VPLGPVFEFLGEILPVSIDLNLGRMSLLLKALGSPHRYMPPVVHVAGTNGKGSVIAFLRSILEEAGYRVHVYTSPHLVRYNERIRLSGRLISDEELNAILKTCLRINRQRPITFFEITTAAAFLAFSQNSADLTLIETGLGGRLDATNLIGRPEVSVLTPISIDHEHYLGQGVKSIAKEKAGILKSGQPAVIARQTAVGSRVIKRVAMKKGSPLWRHGREWTVRHRNFGSIFESLSNRWILPIPGMLGLHQRDNAAVAVATLDLLGKFPVSHRAIWLGLSRTKWPARFQLLRPGPLRKFIRDDVSVWVDGGHNGAAGKALADIIRHDFGGGPVRLIMGMLRTKSPGDFIKPLLPYTEKIYAITIEEEAGLTETELAEQLQKIGAPVVLGGSLAYALQCASSEGSRPVVVCGSLYLAGRALSENNEELS
jgi:dihydrofolate synthase/folylpolyglutamate synthase